MVKRQFLFMITLLLSACGTPTTEVDPPTQPAATATPLPHTETATPLPPTETLKPLPPTESSKPLPTDTATIAYTPTPDIPRELVEVAYEDRVIRGTLLGEGDIAVVLAPMFGLDRSSWMPFARHIATLGYTALAIDFPGAGTSTGRFSFTLVNFDTVAVIDYLTELGYERIVCMGGSMGAGACFQAAIMRPELAGLVIIAAPPETTAEESAGLLMPKLFLVGKEPDVKKDMEAGYKLLPPPKEFKTINNPSHGTDLLLTDAAEEFRDLLVDFLKSIQ